MSSSGEAGSSKVRKLLSTSSNGVPSELDNVFPLPLSETDFSDGAISFCVVFSAVCTTAFSAVSLRTADSIRSRDLETVFWSLAEVFCFSTGTCSATGSGIFPDAATPFKESATASCV